MSIYNFFVKSLVNANVIIRSGSAVLMHWWTNTPDNYKVREFSTLPEHRWGVRRELRSRSGLRFGPLFPFGSNSIRGWTTARANYFNPSTNTARVHSVPDYSGPDCTRARAAAASSLDSSAVCADSTEYEMQQDCASTGRIMVVGPAAEFGARALIEDEGRGIVRSRQIYRAPWNRLSSHGTRSIAWFKYFAITFRLPLPASSSLQIV